MSSNNIFKKIIKRNYNSELEVLLETKKYSEEAKNILLSSLYKIEAWYDDYKTVKNDIESKDEYIDNLFNLIDKDCDIIEIMKITRNENFNQEYILDYDEKKIITRPIDRILLGALFKMTNQKEIVRSTKELKNKTISNLINMGYDIELLEVIRDFNGYSWVPEIMKSKNVFTNIVYQNLRILAGNDELKKLTNKQFKSVNNYDNLMKKLEREFGRYNTNEIEKRIINIALLMFVSFEKESAKVLYKQKEIYENDFKQMEDSTSYVEKVITKKAHNINRIEKLEKIIEDEKSLEVEYNKRNRGIKNEQKIFSKRILKKIIVSEIQDLSKEVKKLEKLVTVDSILRERGKIMKKIDDLKVLSDIDIENDEKILEEIDKQVYFLQVEFLECIKIRLNKMSTKEEAINEIKALRYYNELYAAEKEKVSEFMDETDLLEYVKQIAIKRAVDLKAINTIVQTEDVNYKILSNIFTNKIIDLDKMSIKLEYKNEEMYLYLYDENTLADKIYVGGLRPNQLEELVQKKNKKIKICI